MLSFSTDGLPRRQGYASTRTAGPGRGERSYRRAISTVASVDPSEAITISRRAGRYWSARQFSIRAAIVRASSWAAMSTVTVDRARPRRTGRGLTRASSTMTAG